MSDAMIQPKVPAAHRAHGNSPGARLPTRELLSVSFICLALLASLRAHAHEGHAQAQPAQQPSIVPGVGFS